MGKRWANLISVMIYIYIYRERESLNLMLKNFDSFSFLWFRIPTAHTHTHTHTHTYTHTHTHIYIYIYIYIYDEVEHFVKNIFIKGCFSKAVVGMTRLYIFRFDTDNMVPSITEENHSKNLFILWSKKHFSLSLTHLIA